MPRPITAGLDGSPESMDAARWAAKEALRRGSPLLLVHGWTWQPLEEPDVKEVENQRQWALGMLREAEEELTAAHPGLPVSTEQLPDLATPGLLERAAEAEMLVLGSRGHGAIAGFLLGSVGMQVLARAKSPVVMVRAGDHPEEEVVVALQDLGRPSDALLRFAFATAAARGTTLRAVHTWSLPRLIAHSPVSRWVADKEGYSEAAERAALTEALHPWREHYPETPVVENLQLASAVDAVLDAASGAGLVVVGRRMYRPAFGVRIGPVTHAVLHHTECPVAVVPHD